jgi:exodeoxyribonuclease VII large subunit
MSCDDAIPSFLSLRSPKAKSRKARQTSAPQLAFNLEPVPEPQPRPRESSYKPILLTPEPPPALAPRLTPREPVLYTVRQLLTEIRQHVEQAYTGLLSVEGEISNCRPAGSGHLYFTLKDGEAQLPVVLFRRQAQLLGFKPRDGLSVEVRGRVSVYETRGQLQLIAETLRPRGEGALQLAFEQLKRRLAAEGLFDAARKRPLPPFPHCIGIVTSPSGAALRDIIHVVRRRHARLNLLIYPAIVQGPHCPSTVAQGIRWFNDHPGRVNLILIARGGGSFEDLAGFNDEALARVIAASELPTVSAIGHEIDTTIADFVADLRAPTPSAAAELITAAQHQIEERIFSLERRLPRAAEYHLMHARQRLSRLSAGQVLARLSDAVSMRHQRVDELRLRLIAATNRREAQRTARLTSLEARLRRHDPTVRLAQAHRRLGLAEDRITRASRDLTIRRRARLDRAAARLDALSPLAVLNRGYAIVFTAENKILRDADAVSPGQQIRARLAQGSLTATVQPPEFKAPETENS